VQQPLTGEFTEDFAQAVATLGKPAGLVHRADRVLVDRELVVLVELKQIAGMTEARDHLF
jgi:hypothetical protein